MVVRVPIIGETLRWARELSHVDPDELGRAAGVSGVKIGRFETGADEPTYRQLSLIAKKLDRPVAFFLAPAPNQADVPQTADFRGRAHPSYPPMLAREMKRAEAHRTTMLDLAGPPELALQLGAVTWDNVAASATAVRSQFGLNDGFKPPESQANAVFNFWRGLLEHHGVMVIQTTGIDWNVFRGLSLHHDVLPVILVNGADAANGRVFTLFHELAHLGNRTSGLCILNERVNEEAVCNAFAANFLMPEREVRRVLTSSRGDDDVTTLARQFRVSTLAAAVRLTTLGLLDDEGLEEVKQESEERWKKNREIQSQGEGFVPPWRLRYRDLGPTYVGTVARAIEQDRIDWVDATYLLNARLPMVEQMLQEFYRTGGNP